MIYYPPTGYIMFSFKKLKFYGGRGRKTQTPNLNNEIKRWKTYLILKGEQVTRPTNAYLFR